jgi:hypothetical protein
MWKWEVDANFAKGHDGKRDNKMYLMARLVRVRVLAPQSGESVASQTALRRPCGSGRYHLGCEFREGKRDSKMYLMARLVRVRVLAAQFGERVASPMSVETVLVDHVGFEA